MQVGAQEFYGAFYGILGIVPRLLVVAVVEFFAEPAYVLSQRVEIRLNNACGSLGKLGVFFSLQLGFGVRKQ